MKDEQVENLVLVKEKSRLSLLANNIQPSFAFKSTIEALNRIFETTVQTSVQTSVETSVETTVETTEETSVETFGEISAETSVETFGEISPETSIETFQESETENRNNCRNIRTSIRREIAETF